MELIYWATEIKTWWFKTPIAPDGAPVEAPGLIPSFIHFPCGNMNPVETINIPSGYLTVSMENGPFIDGLPI